jgi:uncharacterized membrane protein YdbT with pleckstrin-like domain
LAYLDSLLQSGETILARSRPHWIILLAPIAELIVAAIAAIATFVALPHTQLALIGYGIAAILGVGGGLHFIARALTRSTTEYGVTNLRVVQKRGILSLHTIEMNLDKVESVDVDQTLLGRMFGFGTVAIHGVGSRWDPIAGIEDPLGFRSAITTHIGASK